jgi:cytochrome c-type protein NapB
MGLSPSTVFDTPTPPTVERNAQEPGESEVAPRAYPGAPPVVSHITEDYLPITVDENLCLSCHGDPEGELAPAAPPSHYVDLRNAPDDKGDEIAGSRYVCTACHVPRTQAAPLVQNRF